VGIHVHGLWVLLALGPTVSHPSHSDATLNVYFCYRCYMFVCHFQIRDSLFELTETTNTAPAHVPTEYKLQALLSPSKSWNALINNGVQVPEGHVWLQGDNATNSTDSRHYGAVPYALLEGRAFLKVPLIDLPSSPCCEGKKNIKCCVSARACVHTYRLLF
jgi:hypothetical protein